MTKMNRLIHQPVRLRIMAALVELEPEEQMNFTSLRDLLDLTDGNLGAHLQKLEDAGYVEIEKAFAGRKPRTFIRATAEGRSAFERHLEALRDLLEAPEE